MPEDVGDIIGGTDRESAINDDHESVDRNEGTVNHPEIIAGYETDTPRTERIDTGTDTAGVRYRKDGTIDGRSARRLNRESTGNSTAKKSVHLNSLSLTDLLYSVHMMGAQILKVESLEIDKDEAKKLSDAIQEVNKFYNIPLDPKKVAMVNLMVAMGTVYGPRIMAARIKKNIAEAENPPAKSQAKPGPVPVARPATQPAAGAKTPQQMTPSELFGTSSDASLG